MWLSSARGQSRLASLGLIALVGCVLSYPTFLGPVMRVPQRKPYRRASTVRCWTEIVSGAVKKVPLTPGSDHARHAKNSGEPGRRRAQRVREWRARLVLRAARGRQQHDAAAQQRRRGFLPRDRWQHLVHGKSKYHEAIGHGWSGTRMTHAERLTCLPHTAQAASAAPDALTRCRVC